MRIWEAIIYAIFGGATELLPISFAGHTAILQSVFGLSSLQTGGGAYVRAGISLGVLAAIILTFRAETRALGRELRLMTGMKRLRRHEAPDLLLRRSVTLGLFALVPMLCSLIFLAFAEHITRLPYVAGLFALNGLLIFSCCRGSTGQKAEREITLPDTLLIGVGRMLAVFPGLSSTGASLCIGRVRGLSLNYNLRLTYMLALAYECAAFLYRLIRAFLYGSFSGTVLLATALAIVFAAVFGYLAMQYFRYLLQRKKLNVFAYYCWDAAVIALVLALINA